jgi:2-polyprenyl-3-methyl-5-hydroxy-6-metoxy-1,4-benzoquinol methylase
MPEEKNLALELDREHEPANWDHSSREQFFEHYAKKTNDSREMAKFRKIRDTILRVLARQHQPQATYEVLDIGCAAGTQCMAWAELGHSVHGLDVNEPLLELARQRAAKAGLKINYQLGSALQLPWRDQSIDILLSLELLEHVEDWQSCLREFNRVLRPEGVIFLATSNKLCPIQYEFNLPAYSWYPEIIKRHYLRVATSKRPELANYATYPAVNWFTPYSLGKALRKIGFSTRDRFDLIDTSRLSLLTRTLVAGTRAVTPLRWLGHVCSPGTVLLAIRGSE